MIAQPATVDDAHGERAPWRERIQVGGFQPFSTVDWPGKIAAVIFLRGCPWRCGYCHNPQLQARAGVAPIAWNEVEAALVRRRGWLDGVVFSGGEPTTDRCLLDAVTRVRELGFAVGLHTGGAYPQRFAQVLPLLEWVGFDLKTEERHYDTLTGTPGSGERAWQSAAFLAATGVDAEFRLTYHSGLVSREALDHLTHRAQQLGVEQFTLQEFRPTPEITTPLPPHEGVPADLVAALKERFPRFIYRPAA